MKISKAGQAPGLEDATAFSLPDDAEARVGDLEQIASGSSINLLGSITRNVLTFAYALFLAAFLQPDSVGYFFLGLTIASLLSTAANMGLDTGVLRFTALYDGEDDRGRVRGAVAGAVVVTSVVSITISAALFLLAGPVADRIFGKPELEPVLRLFSLGIPPFVLARLFNSATQGLRRMRYQVYSRDFGEQLTRFIISAVLLAGGVGVLGVVSANIVALMLAMLLSLYFLHKVEPVFGRSRKRIYEQRRLLRYSAPLAVSTLVTFFLMWTDTLFLGGYQDAEIVGVYSVAVRLAVVGGVILVSFSTIFAPLASDFFNRGQKDRLQSLLQSTNKWVLCLSLPVFAALIIIPGQILGILGSSYVAADVALAILAVGHLVNAAAGPVALLLIMCGRPVVVLISNLVVLAVDIALCLLLIPAYGMEGAALASAVTLILFNVAAMAGVVALLKINPFSSGYVKSAVAGLFAMLLAYGFVRLLPGPWGIAAAAGAFLVSFVSLVLLTAFDKSDMLLLGVLKKKFSRQALSVDQGS